MEQGRSRKAVLRFDFPREVTLYRKVVHDREQFETWWGSLDNASDAYMTVYGYRQLKEPNYKRCDYGSAVIPHFVLDFDCVVVERGERKDVDPSVPLGEVRLLHQHLMAEEILHAIWFSGGGFHVWVKLDRDHLPFNGIDCSIIKNSGRALVRGWADELGLKCIDPTVTFDLASLIRVPNSYNVKRERWCIPLRSEEICEWDWERITQKATHHRSGFYSYGSSGVVLDLSERHRVWEREMEPVEIPTINMGDVAVLPCLQAAACRQGSNPTHDARFQLATYLAARLRFFVAPERLNGQANDHIEQIVDFIRGIGWVDFNEDITRARVNHIVKGGYVHTPCKNLYARGYCVGKCHLWDGSGTIPEMEREK